MKRTLLSPGIRLGLILLSTTLPRAALAADGAAPASPEPALLEVSVNGERLPEPVLLLRDAGGALYAPAAFFEQARLQLPKAEALPFEGTFYHRLEDADGLKLIYSAPDQSLSITAAPQLFERQRATLRRSETMEMTAPATGGFVNYDLFGEYLGGEASLTGAAEVGIFSRHGVGISGFIGHLGSGQSGVTRLDTSWTIDRPASLSSVRIGDSISSAGPGSHPVRFAGIQFARNFAVQPAFLTMPLPVVEGSAALPSVVDVYVNNVLQGSQAVRSGPFELSNVPVPSGGGTVQLVTRDMLGRTVTTEQPYYANAGLLRRGLHDFSYEMGLVRRGFGVRSNDYGELMGSTTHRLGLSDAATGEVHVQASRSTQLAGAGLLLSVPGIGVLGGSAAVSRSSRGTGAHATASFERSLTRLSLGLRAEYADAAFAFIGMPDNHLPPRFNIHAFADAPIAGGAIGLNFVHRDNRARHDETLAGLFGSIQVSRTAALQLYVRHAVAGRAQTTIGGHISFPLGGGRSASASGEYRRGRSSAYVSLQRNAPAGIGGGYRIAASAGEAVALDAQYVHNGRLASYGAQLTHFDGSTGVRLSAAGALAMAGGRAFASRSLGQSFATVQVGDQAGVRVYADNQLVGVTGKDGSVVIPALRAYDRNLVRIEEADLPMDVQVQATEVAVRPFARAGVAVSFPLRRERGLLLQVRLEDGAMLPAGAQVEVEGEEVRHVVASGGEVYLPAGAGRMRLIARWESRSCALDIQVPDNDDPQPRLAGLVCKGVSYAAR